MTTPDAVNRLQYDNTDLVLIRLNGSVKITKIPPEVAAPLNWMDMQPALDAAIEKLKGEGQS